MNILVTGGNGALGREIVAAGTRAGHTVRIASRRPAPATLPNHCEWTRCDLETGTGIASGLAGVDAVIHAATDPRKAEAVDVNGTRNLMLAARHVAVRHLVYVSITGIEHIPVKYYDAKLQAEEIVSSGGVPFSILRATQFHSFLDQVLIALARTPLVLPIPRDFKIQSVATNEVAERLVRCVVDGPNNRLHDFGGPEVIAIEEAAQQWKHARAVRKPLLRIPVPGAAAAAVRVGKNTVGDAGDHGTITWSQWLASSGRQVE